MKVTLTIPLDIEGEILQLQKILIGFAKNHNERYQDSPQAHMKTEWPINEVILFMLRAYSNGSPEIINLEPLPDIFQLTRHLETVIESTKDSTERRELLIRFLEDALGRKRLEEQIEFFF